MKLSTRTRYGVRALLELALHDGQEPVALKDIARRQQISLSYLEQLVAPLIGGGVIRSTKGPKGGISLTRLPADIRLGEVVRLLEGAAAPVECIDNPAVCGRSECCAARDLWSDLQETINDYLQATTLQDLVAKQQGKTPGKSPVREI